MTSTTKHFTCSQIRFIRLALIIIGLLIADPCGVRGDGSETSTRGDDFEMTADSRWTGCEYGGYLPIRLRIVNHGVTRNLRVVMTGEDYNSQKLVVERALNVPQNAIVRATLSVPMVGAGTYASIRVYAPDGEIKSLRQSVTLPQTSGLQNFSPALLVVSSAPIDFTPWRECMYRHVSTPPTHGYYGGYSSYSTVSEISNQETVPASSLPDNWIDYTGLDIVSVSMDDFAALSNEQRASLRKWVHSGGNLFLTGVGAWEDNRANVERLLESDRLLNAAPDWTAADLSRREVIQSGLRPITQVEQERQASMGRGPISSTPAPGPGAPVPAAPEFKWSTDGGVFRSRRLMFGMVYAFHDNPFPGTDADWSWWRSHFPQEKLWIARQGFSSRTGNEEFLDFLIPGIQRFPVAAFLVLITVFSVVIGPVNYFYFLRKKQLAIIVITIPVIAFLTSVSLFSFSALSHGFSIKSRMRSMTLVDQRAQSAITFSRNSLYAGFAPAEGLSFRPDTAVYPLWNTGQLFQSGRVDWTDGQRFYSGWFPSRTRTQFYTATYEDQRSRLDIESPNGEHIVVKNGFPYGLKALGVYGTDGHYYVGYDIPAGASAELPLANSENKRRFVDLVNENKPAMPPEAVTTGGGYSSYPYSRRSYYYSQDINTSFSRSEVSTLFDKCRRFSEMPNPQQEFEGEHFYVGVLAENPGVDLGIKNTKEFSPAHFVIGFYEE
ncbi:MAG: hypothetical protein O2955_03400 [Planctomycetota bacterium]|nr:hypothetical protein [Planctomycetota bacterium]MDA1211534.1 hypothetical protein [Planctomycetota bacterium]